MQELGSQGRLGHDLRSSRAGRGWAPKGLTFPRGHIASLGSHLHFGLFTLPPLPQQLALEGGHGAQQVTALYLRWGDHDAAIQELADGTQEVLPVICLVGSLMKQLGAGEARAEPPGAPLGGLRRGGVGPSQSQRQGGCLATYTRPIRLSKYGVMSLLARNRPATTLNL